MAFMTKSMQNWVKKLLKILPVDFERKMIKFVIYQVLNHHYQKITKPIADVVISQ